MSKQYDPESFVYTGDGFIKYVGIKILKSDDKKHATGIIKLENKHSQIYKAAHGGVIYSLADTVAGRCVWSNIDPDHDMIITLEMKMNYIAACPIEGYAKAYGILKHIGKRTAVCGVDVFHIKEDLNKDLMEEKIIGTAIATFQILRQIK